MAKKHPVKPVPNQPSASKKTATTPPRSGFLADNLVPLLSCIAYLAVHFIPNLDAYDAMGPQWLYIVLIDMLVIAYLLAKKSRYELAAGELFRNIFSKLYIAFFVLAGLSIMAALNRTEFWVCFVRFIATIIAFFNIGILLNNRMKLIGAVAQIIAIFLLLDAAVSCAQFLKDYTQMNMTEAIMNIKGTTGNKNIFAAGLIVKIPFVLYLIHNGSMWKRILNGFILSFGVLMVFLGNARAAFVSLILITILYIVFCILEKRKEKNTEQMLARVGFTLVPIFLALFLSQLIISNVKSIQENENQTYGSLTERLSTINASGGDNLIRLNLWSHAIDYTKHHPLTGSGYGNWKIESIPYVRTMTNDLFVPVHSHNDFLEMFAELGVVGGLLYLSLFICIIIFTIKTYYSGAEQETKLIAVFSLLSFVGYSVDAFFNFPMERPISQVFFVLITAINVAAYIHGRQSIEAGREQNSKPTTLVFGLIGLLLLLPATYVTYLTYQSLVIQRVMIPDLNNEPLKLKWRDIFPKIPSIPNISASAQPMDAIKGRYLSEDSMYREAIVLLDKGSKANPVIGYSEFLKAGIFFKMGKFDSAQMYGAIAFNTRPKAKTYYQTFMAVLAQTKDTIEIKRAYKEYVTYRKEVFGYNLYFIAMMQAKGQKGDLQLLAQADSAYQQFKNDPEANLLLQRKNDIQNNLNATAATPEQQALLVKAQNYYNAGVIAFTKAKAGTEPGNKPDYREAARNFARSGEIITNNYTIYENAGIAYFNLGEYARSIVYFDKAINLKTSTDGKSEYFKGVSLYNLGKQAEGCNFIRIASNKGYAEAATVLKNNCK